jgi:Na+/H+ antiporter NhaC
MGGVESTGTSVGTIVAVAPIAVELVRKAGLSLPLALGALVGGAMFGANLGFALPAALITIILLFIYTFIIIVSP